MIVGKTTIPMSKFCVWNFLKQKWKLILTYYNSQPMLPILQNYLLLDRKFDKLIHNNR